MLISGTFCGLDIDFIQQGGFKKGYWIRGFMFSEDLLLNHAIIHSKIRERESWNSSFLKGLFFSCLGNVLVPRHLLRNDVSSVFLKIKEIVLAKYFTNSIISFLLLHSFWFVNNFYASAHNTFILLDFSANTRKHNKIS